MLNERIREVRILNNISQVELAKKLGVTKQSVSNWENDNIQPSVEMVVKIAKLFSVTTDYLLGLENQITLNTIGLEKQKIIHLQQIIEDMKSI